MTTLAILLLLGASSLGLDASVDASSPSVTGPLSPFFSSPITAVIGRAGWYNCIDGTEVDTLYAIDAIPASVPSLRHEVGRWDRPVRETCRMVVGGVELRALENALGFSNSLFSITDLLFYRCKLNGEVPELRRIEEEDRTDSIPTFYGPSIVSPQSLKTFQRMPDLLDTLSQETVRAALQECEKYRFYLGAVVAEVKIVNAVGDTVRIYSGSMQPYGLPWTIEFDDQRIETYSIDLARLLLPLVPERTSWSEQNEKIYLIESIAWYLHEVDRMRAEGDDYSLVSSGVVTSTVTVRQ